MGGRAWVVMMAMVALVGAAWVPASHQLEKRWAVVEAMGSKEGATAGQLRHLVWWWGRGGEEGEEAEMVEEAEDNPADIHEGAVTEEPEGEAETHDTPLGHSTTTEQPSRWRKWWGKAKSVARKVKSDVKTGLQVTGEHIVRAGQAIGEGAKSIGSSIKSGYRKIKLKVFGSGEKFKIVANRLKEKLEAGDQKAIELMKKLGISITFMGSRITGSSVEKGSRPVNEVLVEEGLAKNRSLEGQVKADDWTTTTITITSSTSKPSSSLPLVDLDSEEDMDKETEDLSTSPSPSTSTVIIKTMSDLDSEEEVGVDDGVDDGLELTSPLPLSSTATTVETTASATASTPSSSGTTTEILEEEKEKEEEEEEEANMEVYDENTTTDITTTTTTTTTTTPSTTTSTTIATSANITEIWEEVEEEEEKEEYYDEETTTIPTTASTTTTTTTRESTTMPTTPPTTTNRPNTTTPEPTTGPTTTSTTTATVPSEPDRTREEEPYEPPPFPDVFGDREVRDRLKDFYDNGDFTHAELTEIFNFDPENYEYAYDYNLGDYSYT